MKCFIVIALAIILSAAVYAHAADLNAILGTWTTEDKDAKIEIYKCGMKYCGRIVWLAEPIYPQNSREGTPGTPILDHNNPDPSLKKRHLLGLQILSDFEVSGENTFDNGRIYDPDSGKTYSGKMHLLSSNQLELRGFMGLSIFGSTTIWTGQNNAGASEGRLFKK
jgi:uncharacterized protein (DUF2147 family)